MIIPAFLKPGDSVFIVAPSGKPKAGSLDVAQQILTSWGLTIKIGKHVFSTNHSYLSGTDEERLQDLQKALDDATASAILCARGGYGISRIVDQLDFTSFLKKPKWIVGFSDITAMHLLLNKMDVQSIHGIMPALFFKPEAESSIDSLKQILFGNVPGIEVPGNNSNRVGQAAGEVVGGNLSLLADSIGTQGDVTTDGKILILEEIEEYKYKIDRMLGQLKRTGKLSCLAGLVIGQMTNILDSETPFGETVEEIVLSKVKEYHYPVAFGFPTGHSYPNLAWVSGSKMKLNVSLLGASLTPDYSTGDSAV